jgi:ACS family tartrate transporter-like MFS transporter
MLAAASMFALSAVPHQSPGLTLLWITLTGGCIFAWNPSFWVLPTLAGDRTARAASIGFINSAGNLGGFFGPAITGFLMSRMQSHLTIVILVSASYAISALLISAVRITDPAIAGAGSNQERRAAT